MEYKGTYQQGMIENVEKGGSVVWNVWTVVGEKRIDYGQ